jgi:hypothetical protein
MDTSFRSFPASGMTRLVVGPLSLSVLGIGSTAGAPIAGASPSWLSWPPCVEESLAGLDCATFTVPKDWAAVDDDMRTSQARPMPTARNAIPTSFPS